MTELKLEIEHPKKRIELISLIGDTCVAFEFSEIQEVITLINDYISGDLLAELFAKEIEKKRQLLMMKNLLKFLRI